jgi:hypothetical protein
MNEPRWRKSSYSGGQGNCVEVAGIVGRVVVRDTKDAATAVLMFSPDAWRKLVTRVKASLGSTLGPVLCSAGSGELRVAAYLVSAGRRTLQG